MNDLFDKVGFIALDESKHSFSIIKENISNFTRLKKIQIWVNVFF